MPPAVRYLVEDWACREAGTVIEQENTACASLANAVESEEYLAAYSDGTLHSDGTAHSDAGDQFLVGDEP